MKKFCNYFVKIIHNNQFIMRNNSRFDFEYYMNSKKFLSRRKII